MPKSQTMKEKKALKRIDVQRNLSAKKQYQRAAFKSCILGAFASLAIAFPLLHSAHARPNTKAYTCQELRHIIGQKGAVVMNTKNTRIFKRFVKNQRYCAHGHYLRYDRVPTRNGTCRVKTCTPHEIESIFQNFTDR